MKRIFFLIVFSYSCSFVYSQWIPLNTGLSQLYTSISAVDDNSVWICGHLGGVSRTTNGGVNWLVSTGTADTLAANNIFGIDQNSAVISGNKYNPNITIVRKTTDGGASWQQVFSQPDGEIKAVEISANGSGIMIGKPVGGRWSLWRTSNYGSTWDSAGMYLQGTGSIVENCLFARGTEYWFGASGGRLYYTSNSGSNWSYQTLGSLNITGIWLNGQTGIVTGSGGFRTTNGGINWSPFSIPGSGYQLPIAGSGSNFWMVTRGSINIFSTTNNGDNWNNFTDFYQYSDIAVSRTGSQVWIATLNNLVLKAGVNAVTQISSQIPGNYKLSQNYPNPFNPVTNIKFFVPKSTNIRLAIYDVNGRELEILVNQSLSAGTYNADWNASKYASGVYFYKITAADFTETKKMMLIK